MHPLFDKGSSLTGEIIAAAIEVHKALGPGLIESIYEWALMRELELRGFSVCNGLVEQLEEFSRKSVWNGNPPTLYGD